MPAPVSNLSFPKVEKYRVVMEAHVPQQGGYFVLPKGKVISSAQYDIEWLKKLGVLLESAESDAGNPLQARLVG